LTLLRSGLAFEITFATTLQPAQLSSDPDIRFHYELFLVDRLLADFSKFLADLDFPTFEFDQGEFTGQ
jgi:hypothetical protein